MYKLRDTETGEIVFQSKLKWECEYRERELTLYRPGWPTPSLEIVEEPDQINRPAQKPTYMIIHTATGKPIYSSQDKTDCEYKAFMLRRNDPSITNPADLIVVKESDYYKT